MNYEDEEPDIEVEEVESDSEEPSVDSRKIIIPAHLRAAAINLADSAYELNLHITHDHTGIERLNLVRRRAILADCGCLDLLSDVIRHLRRLPIVHFVLINMKIRVDGEVVYFGDFSNLVSEFFIDLIAREP